MLTNRLAFFWVGFFVPITKASCTFQSLLVILDKLSISQEIFFLLYLDWLLPTNSICLYPVLNSLVH